MLTNTGDRRQENTLTKAGAGADIVEMICEQENKRDRFEGGNEINGSALPQLDFFFDNGQQC